MNKKPSIQDQIQQALTAAIETVRGTMSLPEQRNYILAIMLIRYITDTWKHQLSVHQQQYGKDNEIVHRKMKRVRFILPQQAHFDYLYQRRNDADIGRQIDQALDALEMANAEKLRGVFGNISFNNERLGSTSERNRRLQKMLEAFAHPVLEFQPDELMDDARSRIAVRYIIEKFANEAGREGVTFCTPLEIGTLLAELVAPSAGSRICDPMCGTASLLIAAADQVVDTSGNPSHDVSLYGQELDRDTWALAKFNLFFHNRDAARVAAGDTILTPHWIENGQLLKFDAVVACPPFSTEDWGYEQVSNSRDPFNRFTRGLPPRSKGDYAFILHILGTLLPSGVAAVVVSHGALFRGGVEAHLRQQLVEENLVDAVIGLPANIFGGISIPTAVLIFRRQRTTTDVLFIDASHGFLVGKKQNTLRAVDRAKIVQAYRSYANQNHYARRVDKDSIRSNDFNLTVSRYVKDHEQKQIDIRKHTEEIGELRKELAVLEKQIDDQLNALGH